MGEQIRKTIIDAYSIPFEEDYNNPRPYDNFICKWVNINRNITNMSGEKLKQVAVYQLWIRNVGYTNIYGSVYATYDSQQYLMQITYYGDSNLIYSGDKSIKINIGDTEYELFVVFNAEYLYRKRFNFFGKQIRINSYSLIKYRALPEVYHLGNIVNSTNYSNYVFKYKFTRNLQGTSNTVTVRDYSTNPVFGDTHPPLHILEGTSWYPMLGDEEWLKATCYFDKNDTPPIVDTTSTYEPLSFFTVAYNISVISNRYVPAMSPNYLFRPMILKGANLYNRQGAMVLPFHMVNGMFIWISCSGTIFIYEPTSATNVDISVNYVDRYLIIKTANREIKLLNWCLPVDVVCLADNMHLSNNAKVSLTNPQSFFVQFK